MLPATKFSFTGLYLVRPSLHKGLLLRRRVVFGGGSWSECNITYGRDEILFVLIVHNRVRLYSIIWNEQYLSWVVRNLIHPNPNMGPETLLDEPTRSRRLLRVSRHRTVGGRQGPERCLLSYRCRRGHTVINSK